MLHAILSMLLGAVFLVSGAAKLADPRAWRAQSAGLRVPQAVAAVLPYVEVVLGAAVAVQLMSPWPAAGAVVMLVAFTAVIAANLRAGRHPPCACFGAWSATPVSWRHVARNAVFIALAAVTILTT